VLFDRYIPEFWKKLLHSCNMNLEATGPSEKLVPPTKLHVITFRHICLKCWYLSTKLHTAWHHTPEDPNLICLFYSLLIVSVCRRYVVVSLVLPWKKMSLNCLPFSVYTMNICTSHFMVCVVSLFTYKGKRYFHC